MRLNDWIEQNMIRIPMLAKRLGITKSYLYYILNEERKPGKELMQKIQELTNGKVKSKDFEKQ